MVSLGSSSHPLVVRLIDNAISIVATPVVIGVPNPTSISPVVLITILIFHSDFDYDFDSNCFGSDFDLVLVALI